MLDNYKNEYDKIEVPSHLKAETLLKMEKVKKKKISFLLTKTLLTSMSICVLIIGTYFFLQGDKDTVFISGETIEEVSVKGQKIQFDNVDNDLKLSGDGILKRQHITKEKAMELWQDTMPVIDLQDKASTSVIYYAYYKDITPTYVEFVLENKGCQIVVSNTNKKIETNSTIEGIKVYVSYQKKQDATKYTMIYVKEGNTYTILSETLNQEQFINESVKYLKKVK